MAKSPAFQFYPDDFMGGKPGLMTPEETHVYIWLLCLDWNHGAFAYDEAALARWCHVPVRVIRKAWPAVRACFDETGGLFHNSRLEQEREKQRVWREKSSLGGKQSAKQRATTLPTVVQPPLQPNGQPKGNIPFPTPLPTNSITTSAVADTHDFDLAWAAYPKRAGGNVRKDALKAWQARRRSGVDSDVMHDGTLRYAAFCLATGKVGTEFVMQGARFYGPSQPFAEEWALPESAKPKVYSGDLSPEDFKRLSA